MKNILEKVHAAFRLGIGNVLRVIYYRTTLALELNAACRIQSVLLTGQFFSGSASALWPDDKPPVTRVFGQRQVVLTGPPYDWFRSVISQRRFNQSDQDWWRIGDFNNDVGDIKGLWEISRFSWVPILARSASGGNVDSTRTLNTWLSDWCEKNPPYKGPNWKCGQETSLRILNLALGALILDQVASPSTPLRALVAASLKRVMATRSYAMAQNNNHGTSEGAGLFVGGAWLRVLGDRSADRYAEVGRRQLERLARRLINSSGGFSQYSINYHRVALDTLIIVELWRRTLSLREFSAEFYERCSLATEWLENFVDGQSHDAPVIGANDGAHLLEFLNPAYRNYRFSVQLASVVFRNRLAFDLTEDVRDALSVLDLPVPAGSAARHGVFLDDEAGFASIRRQDANVFVRFPRFRFRPGHADALHVDLWVGGRNVLPDGGTYSYNCDAETESYFMGVQSHNTLQFDGREQMPRLSRFLFGGWPRQTLRARVTESSTESAFLAGYRDFCNASHQRRLVLSGGKLVVTDQFNGFSGKAVLRWRLGQPGWTIQSEEGGIHVRNDAERMHLRVRTGLGVERAELVQGYHSRFYGEREPIQVLEVEVSRPGSLITEIAWCSGQSDS